MTPSVNSNTGLTSLKQIESNSLSSTPELPPEILTMILNVLSTNVGKNWNAPACVNRQWRCIYNSIHVIKSPILQVENAEKQIKNEEKYIISNIKRYIPETLHYMSRWLEVKMNLCEDDDTKTTALILNNMPFCKFKLKHGKNKKINAIVSHIDFCIFYESSRKVFKSYNTSKSSIDSNNYIPEKHLLVLLNKDLLSDEQKELADNANLFPDEKDWESYRRAKNCSLGVGGKAFEAISDAEMQNIALMM